MKLYLKIFILVLTFIIFTSCKEDEGDRFQETVEIQAQENVEASNDNVEFWAQQLEEDLEQRRRFIDAIKGEFSGLFYFKEQEFNLRITFSPTIPEYSPDRIRRLEEIVFELQNLNLNIHIIQWPVNNPLAAIGCVFEGIRPDIIKGQVDLFSKNCSISYSLLVGDSRQEDSSAQEIAKDILSKELEVIDQINGNFRANTNANIFLFQSDRAQ